MTRLRMFALWLLLTSPAFGQAPKVTADLKPGTSKARGTLSGGPQQLTLNITSTIKEEKGNWVITDVTETPLGNSTETVTLEKGTLILRKRVVEGGEGKVSYEVSENKITGLIDAAGRQIPISLISDTPLFADGSAAAVSIALLPLAEGYSTTYYNFDPGSQRIIPVHLRVVGSETITVPTGTFDTFKIEVAPESGLTQSTLWIAKSPRGPVKGTSVLHTGATLTIEGLP